MALLGNSALKVIQRQIYSCLARPYGVILLIGGVLATFIAVLHLGEVALQWSMNQYAAQFNLYHDNIGGRTYQQELCAHLPIDVVYTWVNGSDPQLMADLALFKHELEVELNATRARQELERQQLLEAEERAAMNCTTTSKNVTICRKTNNFTRAKLKDDGDSTEVICPFVDCVPLHALVAQMHMPENTTVEEFRAAGFSNAARVFKSRAGGWSGEMAMVVGYGSKASFDADATALKSKNMTWGNKSLVHTECYVTTSSTLKRASTLEDYLFVKSLPENVLAADVVSFVNRTSNGSAIEVHLWPTNNSALVRFINRTFATTMFRTPKTDLKLQDKQLDLSYGYLVWAELKDPNAPTELPETDDISSASRFQDNEELRFSLRALEKNAPWVRNIYIVTNGQIPNWLNLNHPRIKIIAHKDIFVNQSHLPTFSSPAIESHVFRIPGLSERFLYLNDDVMFGQPIWPDDFYTHSRGHKVYLAWSVPQCSKGCPNTWLRDNYCDSACNTSLCDWDGGDCLGLKPGQKRQGSTFTGIWSRDKSKYCHGSCADTWIGDRYCDTACNVLECGYDAGDCETGNYDKIWTHPVLNGTTNVTVPTGTYAVYFNLSNTFTKVKTGEFSDSAIVRAAIVSQKFKVLTIVFNRNVSLSVVSLFMGGERDNITTDIEVNITLLVDTEHLGEDPTSLPATNQSNATNATSTTPPVVFGNSSISHDQAMVFWSDGVPSHWSTTPRTRAMPTHAPNVSNMSVLPADVQAKLIILKEQLHDEEITEKGYHRFTNVLLAPYRAEILASNAVMPAPSVASVTNAADIHSTTNSPSVSAAPSLSHAGEPESHVGQHSSHSDTLQRLSTTTHASTTRAGSYHSVSTAVKESSHDKITRGVSHQLKDQPVVAPHATTTVPIRFTSSPLGSPVSTATPKKGISSLAEESQGKRSQAEKTIEAAQAQWDRSPTGQASPDRLGHGALPWEQKNTFRDMVTELHNLRKAEEEYRITTAPARRHLMDTFADSLRYVNRLFNRVFGFKSRKVPAHMPHFIDKSIFARLQTQFAEEFDQTSSHRLRSPEDMQFSFSYFYYMMSETKTFNLTEVFERFDVDNSGHWSHRELRTVALRLYDPLEEKNVKEFEDMIVNCWLHPNQTLDEDENGAAANSTHCANCSLCSNATLCANCSRENCTNSSTTAVPNVTASTGIPTGPSTAPTSLHPTTTTPSAVPLNSSTSQPRNASTSASTNASVTGNATSTTSPPLNHTHLKLPLPDDPAGNDTQGLPTVTLSFLMQCRRLIKKLNESMRNDTMNRYEEFGEDDVSFEMLPDNISLVADQLDNVRRNPRKFVCLNDNIDHRKEDSIVIKAMIREFYESLFPLPSQFELSPEVENRFLHVDELRKWQREERIHRFWIRCGVVSLFALIFVVYCLPKVRRVLARVVTSLGLSRRRLRLEMRRV